MAHLKRQAVPKNWPIKRKGTTFIAKPNSNFKRGIPVLIVLRDILKFAENRKEVKKAINKKDVLINGKLVIDERKSMVLFDVLTMKGKNYKLDLEENGKFGVKEISDKEANEKISKITNKKVLKGKKTQLNLLDGRNCICDLKCNIDDSVLIDLKSKKITNCLPLKEKANVIIFSGKHAGEKGSIEKIDKERKMAVIDSDGKKVNVLIKQLMVAK